MKNYRFCLATLIVFLNISCICAQTEASAADMPKSPVAEYLSDRNARFPNLSEYLSQHLVYPQLAHENGLEGTVKAEVLLNAVGKVTEVRILEGMGNVVDTQVIQLLREMPHWMPAVRNGHTAPQRVIVPVKFSLK
ncbi:MAG: energy transducer TonB [Saprospiraceae bacterium]